MKHVSSKLLLLLALAGTQILLSQPLHAGSKEVVRSDALNGVAADSTTSAGTKRDDDNFFKNWTVEDVAAGPVAIHGYAGQGVLYTGKTNFPTNQSGSGDARFTSLAINGRYNILPNLSLGMQIGADQLGNRGELLPDVDWAMVDWQINSSFGIRGGRVKLPLGLYNESQDVDAARTFVFLPMGVYSPLNRTLLASIDGGEFYGNIPLGKGGDLGSVDYTTFMGVKSLNRRSYVGDSLQSNSPINTEYTNSNFLTGFGLVYNTPVQGLRFGATYAYIDEVEEYGTIKTAGQLTTSGSPVLASNAAGIGFLAGQPVTIDFDSIHIWVLSTEYTTGKWDFNGEFTRTEGITHTYSPLSTSAVESPVSSQSWYVSSTYQAQPWLSLGSYFNQSISNYEDWSGSKQAAASGLPKSAYFTNDLALTARFDISRNWIFKLEGHAINGSSYVQNSVGQNPGKSLDSNWFLFAAKTTWTF